jgi:CAAX prenyl protease-like protein
MFLLVGLGLIWFTSRMPFFTVAPADDDVAPAADDPHFAMLAGASGASGASGAFGASGCATAAFGSGTAAFGSGAATGAARSSPAAPGAMYGPSVPACLAPFLALLATTILAGAFSTKEGIDILYPLRVVVVAVVLWRLRHEFRWREATLSPVAVALGAATCLLWMLLAPAIMLPDPQEAARQDPAQLGMVGGSVWLLFRFIGYTITVPIAEELAFRGFLARRLISEQVERVPLGTFTWLSFLGSSLAFGLLHGGAWLPGTLAGMAFLLALYHRRQIVDAIVAHATTNALIGFYAIATNAWAALG